MKVKAFTALAALGVAASLAACGSNKGSSSGTSSAGGSGSKHYRITFIPGLKDNPFYISMNCGAQAEAAKLGGVTVNDQGANAFDPTQQIPVVNAVTAAKPDAVLIAPTDTSALIPPMLQMKQRGIKVVQVDTKVSDDSVSVSQVSSDNVQGGALAADQLAKLIGKRGSVLLISLEPGVSTDDLRKQGFEQEIKRYPGIKYLGVQYDNESPSTATSEVNAVLSAHPDLKGVFTTDFFGAQGAYTSAKAAGKAGSLKIVTFDATPDVVKAIKDRSVAGAVSQSPYEQGVLGVEYAVKALHGQPVPPKTLLPLLFITAKNVDAPSVAKYLYKPTCS